MKKTEGKSKAKQISTKYLNEAEWFKAKYEREIRKSLTRKETSLTDFQEYFRRRQKPRSRSYREYKERSRPDNIPDVVWRGPLMKKCKCAPGRDCECQGNIVSPATFIPFEIRYTWQPMYYLRALTFFKKWQPEEPEKNFAQRFLQSVYVEKLVYKRLKEMNALEARGPELCFNRCLHHCIPEAESRNLYLSLKKELRYLSKAVFEEEKEEEFVTEENEPPEEVQDTDDLDEADTIIDESYSTEDLEQADKIDLLSREDNLGLTDTIIDGYYRTVATQATTDPNGEFIIKNISHILFGSIKAYNICDIDGKKVNVCCFEEPDIGEDLPTITSKLENLFSFKGIKNRISKFTNNLYSSIIEIKDTGIPVNTQATQDPPLDDFYQSIIEISPKDLHSEEGHAESCLCCKYYRKYSHNFEEIGDENEFQTKGSDSKSIPHLSLSTSEKKVTEVKDDKLIEGRTSQKFDDSSILLPQRDIPEDNIALTKLFDSNEVGRIESSKCIQEKENTNEFPKLSQVSDNENEVVEMLKSRDEKEKEANEYFKTCTSIDQDKLKSNYKIPEKQVAQISKVNLENVIEEDAVILQKKEAEMFTNKPTSNLLDNTENTLEKKKRSNESLRKPSSVNQEDAPKKHATVSSKIDVRMLLGNETQLKFKFTQKPSLKRFVNENSQKVYSRKRIRNVFSYENIKLHVKKSFQTTSSAFSTFFKCVNFTSPFNIRRSKGTYIEKEDKPVNTDTSDKSVKELDSLDRRNFEISEEEMFSLQYTSDLMNKANSSEANTN